MMITQKFCIFDTAIGQCGMAWTQSGISRLQLPELDDENMRSRLLEGIQAEHIPHPPAAVSQAIEQIVRLLSGTPLDLTSIELDMSGLPTFARKVYEETRKIAPGTTATYGEIATRLGDPKSSRAVGQALGRNPFAIIVPCHRVLAAGNKLGGFSAAGGTATKHRLLMIEGAIPWQATMLFE